MNRERKKNLRGGLLPKLTLAINSRLFYLIESVLSGLMLRGGGQGKRAFLILCFLGFWHFQKNTLWWKHFGITKNSNFPQNRLKASCLAHCLQNQIGLENTNKFQTAILTWRGFLTSQSCLLWHVNIEPKALKFLTSFFAFSNYKMQKSKLLKLSRKNILNLN